MVIPEGQINNIMGGMQETAGIRLNNHKHKLRHRFDIVKKLGQGTYGKVQLAINKETGQDVAIKTIRKAKIETEKDLIRIRREIQIMSSVTHPHIIHIFEVFENRDKMVLVMEYAAGGELYDYLSEKKVLSENDARRIFRQVASACYYCHKHKICHRDLKLENILLDEYGNAKIADFGLSNVFDDSRLLSTYCGSPLYASPEIVRGTPYVGPEVDCWSLGVLLYTLVYGAMPFDGSNFKKLVKQITAGDFYEPQKRSTASELIHALLTPQPQQRASMLDTCSHWWVNQDEEVNCLEAAEELANQTPVRLDLLLSLAPQEPDKEHVMAQPAEAIVPPASDKEPTEAQFGASDSLSLNSAMELEPAASSVVELTAKAASDAAAATAAAGGSHSEIAAAAMAAIMAASDKTAKRALEDGEEKAARKAEKARKREGEKAAKKKKRPPSEPPVPEEDVSMGEVAEPAAAGGGDKPAGGARQAKVAAAAPQPEAAPQQRPQSPVAAAPEAREPQPEAEKVQGKPEDSGPTEEDFPAVEAPQVSEDAAKVPLAAETALQDDQTPAGLDKAAEADVIPEPSVQSQQPQPDEKESDAGPATKDSQSILDNNVPQEGISEGKPAEGPVHTSSNIALTPVEPKVKEVGETLAVKDSEVEPSQPGVVSSPGDSSTPTAPSNTVQPKESAEVPAALASPDDGEKASGQKSGMETGVSEAVPKEQSPARAVTERSGSPKKSRIPVMDTKLSDSQAKKSKVPHEPIDKGTASIKEPQLSVKKPSSSQSDETISPSKKPARSPSDMKQDVPAPPRKRTPPKEDGNVSAPKAKDESGKPEEHVKDKHAKPARIARPCRMEEKEEKELKTPEVKPKDEVAKPAEKTKDNVIKPAEKSADKIAAPLEKSKEPSPKSEEKPKPKLVKAEERTEDKTAQPRPSEKVTERRSPARGSAERVPSASSVPAGVRPSPIDTRAPPVPPAAAAAISRLSRVASEESQRPAPAARADDRAQSLPPRRAASKEYIIPIRLVDDEEPQPAAAPPPAPTPVSTPAPPASASPAASAPTPASAPAQPRRQRPVSHTSSLRSLPEDLSSDDGGSGGGAAEELPPPAREPLRKSRREFIIPIALEGGGTMTPTVTAQTRDQDREQGGGLFKTHQLSGQRRLGSLLGDRSSRDELWGAPLGLQRLSSMRCLDDRPLLEPGGWPSDRPRLSRPRMTSTERADSLSSGGDDDDDDDDQFDFFTAESLFGNLMDRMKSLSKRIDREDTPAKRSLLMSEPLRLERQLSGSSSSSSQRGQHRMPGLWGMHGQVKSLFDKPMTFPHGSLFDQPPFSRHSSFGSHQGAAAAESSDSGGSQHEDDPPPTTGGTRHKTTTVRKTASSSSTPPKTKVATITFKIKPKDSH